MLSHPSPHPKFLPRPVRIFAGLLAVGLLVSCGPSNDALEDGNYQVHVAVTSFGIPHIKANDWGSLGYGYGYHFASDNLCVLAQHLLRVRGKLSATFGVEDSQRGNYTSDVVSSYFMSEHRMMRLWQSQGKRLQDLVTGYAAGFNRYLLEIPPGRHESCRDADWLKPMQPMDVMRMVTYVYNLAALSQPFMMQALVDAQPGQVAAEHSRAGHKDLSFAPADLLPQPVRDGSNAWGLGHRSSQNRRPLLLGNPHYPWHGPRRFYEAHLTIPGELDVMGAAIYGSPLTNIGFSQNLAWTHTVSNAARFTLYELTIKRDDPHKYLYDDVWMPIRSKEVTVEVLENGKLSTRKTSLHFTEYGPLLNLRRVINEAPWTEWPNPEGRAYAMRDISTGNHRFGEQLLSMVTAEDLDSFIEGLKENLSLSFVNTVAVSRTGDAWYGDITTVPFVSDERWEACRPGEIGNKLSAILGQFRAGSQPIPVLDGSRSECQWEVSDESPQPGLMPAHMLPELKTREYVANSNDSYWLTNLETPLEGFSKILGGENYRISLRSQMGLSMIDKRVRGTDGMDTRDRFSLDNLKETAVSTRNGAGERFANDIGRLCVERKEIARSAKLRRGCSAMNNWKLTNAVDDRGGMFFNRVWMRIRKMPNLFDVPFSTNTPLDTPRYLNIQDEQVAIGILNAIEAEIDFFAEHGMKPDAPLSALQYVVRNGDRIPIPGGPRGTGSFNMAVGIHNGKEGWSEIRHGNSYIQVVTWDKKAENIIAEAVLTYSQSTDPASPHYDDQTRLYSQGGWVTLPFNADAVKAATITEYELTGQADFP